MRHDDKHQNPMNQSNQSKEKNAGQWGTHTDKKAKTTRPDITKGKSTITKNPANKDDSRSRY